MHTRKQLKLTLEGARVALAAAEKKALEMQVPVDIAVVDEGGFLLAFIRMDGAKLSSVEVALTKARGSALRGGPSGPSPSSGDPNVILSLGLSLATENKLTAIRGGVPLIVEGEMVGAIGVSAGTEEEDVMIAQAGADALKKTA